MSADLINSFFTDKITVTRPGKGRYVRGYYKGDKTPEILQVSVNIQNATPSEITMFPEGRRGGEKKVVYSPVELLIPDEGKGQTKGDTFVYKGNTYEVHGVEDWSDNTDLPHWKCFCLKIDDQKGADRG